MSKGISIRGIKELEAKLKQNGTLNAVKKIVKTNGAELNRKAARKAPYVTGFLMRSIIFELADGGLTATSTATAHYAPYLEYGTRFMSAQPFMYPAYLEQKAKFLEDLGRLTR